MAKKRKVRKRKYFVVAFIPFTSGWIIAPAHIYLCLVSFHFWCSQMRKNALEAVAKRINFGLTVRLTDKTNHEQQLLPTLAMCAHSAGFCLRLCYLSSIDSFIHFIHSEHIYSFHTHLCGAASRSVCVLCVMWLQISVQNGNNRCWHTGTEQNRMQYGWFTSFQ